MTPWGARAPTRCPASARQTCPLGCARAATRFAGIDQHDASRAPTAPPIGRRGVLALALGATGCATLPREPCRLGAGNTLPIAMAGNLPFVTMTVNGRAAIALLDTGAETSLVTDAFRAGVPMPVDPTRLAVQVGATGRTEARPLVFLPRVRLGTLEILSQRVGVVPQPQLPGPDRAPVGIILGGDILGQHDLDLDLAGRRVTLHPAEPCRLDAAPFPGPSYALPLTAWRNRPVVEVMVNGTATQALLDTGATLIKLSRGTARWAGITAQEIAAAPQRLVRGINNRTEAAALIRLTSLRIGPEEHRDVPVLVGGDGPADAVIGTPWLLRRRVFLAWASRTAFVGPGGGTPVPAVPLTGPAGLPGPLPGSLLSPSLPP